MAGAQAFGWGQDEAQLAVLAAILVFAAWLCFELGIRVLPKMNLSLPQVRLFWKRAPSVMLLSRVVEYLTEESAWIADYQNDPEHTWVNAARQEIKDQFSTGQLTALGRRQKRSSRGSLERTALTWIPQSDWETAWFAIVKKTPDGGGDNSVWIDHEVAWDDVRVEQREVKKVWRPLNKRERETMRAPIATMTEEDRLSGEVLEYLYEGDR